jgi:lantibiotic biosynthesis protein
MGEHRGSETAVGAVDFVLDTQLLRAVVNEVADALITGAIGDSRRSTWLTAHLDGGRGYSTGDPNLYDGSAGIALATWAAATALDRAELADLSRRAITHAIEAADREVRAGLFTGRAGIAMSAIAIGDATSDNNLRRKGVELMIEAARAPLRGADLIGGSAGIILALLSAARITGQAEFLVQARRHGEHLMNSARRDAWGWNWPDPDFGPTGLCGLAHGSSGVMLALGALAADSGECLYRAGVDAARRYERSWYQSAEGGWPDLRADSARTCMSAWCHGSVGIGLSRLALYQIEARPAVAAEAAAAIQSATSAAAHEVGSGAVGITICHGLGGTMLLLQAAETVLGESEHGTAARWLAGHTLDRVANDPMAWPSGIPNGAFSPGLMTGVAGTLYVLSRLLAPSAADVLLPILGGPRPPSHLPLSTKISAAQ